MMERFAEESPCRKARIAGFFYLLTILTGIFAFFVSGRLVVSSDAAATAVNILAHEPLFRLGWGFNLVMVACYVAVTALFYGLFRPVNRSLSLVAAFFSLVGCAVLAVSCVFDLAPFVLLRGAPYLSGFQVEQLQALALVLLKLGGQTYNISLVFFGFYCLLIGYLICRSTFLPRILGALMAFAGLGGLTYLSPPLANYLSSYVTLASLIGEGSLTLWLLVMGVNEERWKEPPNAAREVRL